MVLLAFRRLSVCLSWSALGIWFYVVSYIVLIKIDHILLLTIKYMVGLASAIRLDVKLLNQDVGKKTWNRASGLASCMMKLPSGGAGGIPP